MPEIPVHILWYYYKLMQKVCMIWNAFLWLTNTFTLVHLEVLQHLRYCRPIFHFPCLFLLHFKTEVLYFQIQEKLWQKRIWLVHIRFSRSGRSKVYFKNLLQSYRANLIYNTVYAMSNLNTSSSLAKCVLSHVKPSI